MMKFLRAKRWFWKYWLHFKVNCAGKGNANWGHIWNILLINDQKGIKWQMIKFRKQIILIKSENKNGLTVISIFTLFRPMDFEFWLDSSDDCKHSLLDQSKPDFGPTNKCPNLYRRKRDHVGRWIKCPHPFSTFAPIGQEFHSKYSL